MSGRESSGTVGNTSTLSMEARTLYLKIVEDGGKLHRDTAVCGAELDELVRIGLLVPDSDEPGILVAVDPAQLSDSLSKGWQRQALDLLSQAVSIPSEFQELVQAFHVPEKSGGSIEHVRGKVLINQRIAQVVAAGMEEALAMQPGGPRPPDVLASMIERDLDTLQRGTTMRTIYHASTRYHQPTRDYVATLAKAGGQYRTLDEPYTRLIVIDRRIAVIPLLDDMNLAVFIHDPAVVNYMAEEVFEKCWSRALDFDGDRAVPQQVVSRLRQTIIDLLLAGTNHRVIARRLGISERTLARHIAEMREDYNVESLFQLGYVLARASHETPS
ncbi:helix-turn-helix domain-containing protein [Kitasatospora terrestris]|uniref:LuxR C-terminal-related transcriptional regulator n=1 Tax=Kitasatospora terrestris TaxID=258051 RepID=A0ABP9DU21_9ACTN